MDRLEYLKQQEKERQERSQQVASSKQNASECLDIEGSH